MGIMSNEPSERFDGVLDANQLFHERRSVDALCKQREGQLTSGRWRTLGEADWGKEAGAEEGDWERTDIIWKAVGVRMGEGEGQGVEAYILLAVERENSGPIEKTLDRQQASPGWRAKHNAPLLGHEGELETDTIMAPIRRKRGRESADGRP